MDKRRNKIWKNIAEKTQYRVDIVMTDLTHEQALEKEKEFVMLYGKVCDNSGCLANILDFGSGSIKNRLSESEKIKKADRMIGNKYAKDCMWSDDRKLRMSILRKGYKNNLGKTWSEETKKKMSLGHMGNTATKGYKWITNGVINNMINSTTTLSEGYQYGITKNTNKHLTLN